MVAIFGLVSALGGAYVHTWIDAVNMVAAKIMATVTLFFVAVPIIKLSGSISSFTLSIDAIHIIQDLRMNLCPGYQLFPPLPFLKSDRWDGKDVVSSEEDLVSLILSLGFSFTPALMICYCTPRIGFSCHSLA